VHESPQYQKLHRIDQQRGRMGISRRSKKLLRLLRSCRTATASSFRSASGGTPLQVDTDTRQHGSATQSSRDMSDTSDSNHDGRLESDSHATGCRLDRKGKRASHTAPGRVPLHESSDHSRVGTSTDADPPCSGSASIKGESTCSSDTWESGHDSHDDSRSSQGQKHGKVVEAVKAVKPTALKKHAPRHTRCTSSDSSGGDSSGSGGSNSGSISGSSSGSGGSNSGSSSFCILSEATSPASTHDCGTPAQIPRLLESPSLGGFSMASSWLLSSCAKTSSHAAQPWTGVTTQERGGALNVSVLDGSGISGPLDERFRGRFPTADLMSSMAHLATGTSDRRSAVRQSVDDSAESSPGASVRDSGSHDSACSENSSRITVGLSDDESMPPGSQRQIPKLAEAVEQLHRKSPTGNVVREGHPIAPASSSPPPCTNPSPPSPKSSSHASTTGMQMSHGPGTSSATSSGAAALEDVPQLPSSFEIALGAESDSAINTKLSDLSDTNLESPGDSLFPVLRNALGQCANDNEIASDFHNPGTAIST
jgi:hypothetical protein